MQAFEDYFFSVWGARWSSIRQAVYADKRYRSVLPYHGAESPPYYLDEASARLAEHLGVVPGECVLDMCAAPGGKSLILLNTLSGSGSFYANDKERFFRLKQVIDQHGYAGMCVLSASDGSILWKRYSECFDAILVDAPCSSEAHWLRDGKWEEHWRISRPKRLAIKQYALLASALMMLRVGGRVLYATCALNPLENEQVIDKALARWGSKVRCSEALPEGAEPARHGFYYLPDGLVGGPLYGCLLYRVSS